MPNRSSTLRLLPTVVAVAVSCLSAGRANGQQPCPPDEWFCEAAPAPSAPEPLPAPSDDVSPTEPVATPEAPEAPEAPAIAPSPPVATTSPPEIEGATATSSAQPEPGRNRMLQPGWGVNVRVQGVVLGQEGGRDAATGLGGVGASVRYRLNPTVTLDGGFDTVFGDDYNGYERAELALSASVLFFLNPQDVFHTYAVVGFNTSSASVDLSAQETQRWRYVGVQGGLGLSVPVNSEWAVNGEFIGFLRARTDAHAASQPEFTDDAGRVSNTSGGGVLRLGLTFAW